ncbi:MAG: phenylalanine--tRNA ligase subunit beta [Bacteroidota bacterium]|nr:phenylalanine--tRNA ligase subunit beta [Bacteroidota bacterium]
MRISYNWLKEYIDLDLNPEELSEILTDCGLEVEGLEKAESVKGGMEGIVIGQVLTAEKHPNADKLSVTTVDVGRDKPLHIVCGAPNVAAGQKVVVATVGTRLYMDDKPFEIRKAKIRGEKSEGMICAEDELGLGTSHEGIMVLEEDAQIGMPAKEYFEITEDYVYEIGLTPNRADAASHLGVARDLVAVLNQAQKTSKYQLKIPDTSAFKVDNDNRHIDIEIENPEACPRYTGITLSNIEVKESPNWLKNRLNTIGVRPINNIVDVTNYVLFELGQPLHAFDADKIKGEKVIVKMLPDKTRFTTLDEVERELLANDLMICNAEDGMCIAGVFGGISSGVTEKTKNVFLESACFNPVHIRKTSKYHSLQTDASFRFERGTDPNITEYALKRAILLFREVAGGQVSSEIVDVYPEKIEAWDVDIAYTNVDRLIGKKIDRESIKKILKDLGIEIKDEKAEGLKVSVPPFKVDVTREVDLIEEILRIYGYNNIDYSGQMRSSLSFMPKPDPEKIQNLISDLLTSNGFNEVMNNSLSNARYIAKSQEYNEENNVRMLNPISADLDIMRQGLIFGMLESAAYNLNRKNEDLRFYEFGTSYRKIQGSSQNPLLQYEEARHLALLLSGNKQPESWANREEKTDIYQLKAYLHNIFSRLGIAGNEVSIKEEAGKDFCIRAELLLPEQSDSHPGQCFQGFAEIFRHQTGRILC